MPFCTTCGAEVSADAAFCPKCGKALGPAPAAAAAAGLLENIAALLSYVLG